MQEFLYKYRDDLYRRVTVYNTKRTPSFDLLDIEHHDQKLPGNIRRARKMIEAYALCNDWDYFGTFTLDPKLRDRSDLSSFRDHLMHFFRDCRKAYNCDLQYVCVPELHKSADAWHMHALVRGVPVSRLVPFTVKQKLPYKLLDEIRKGRSVFDWPDYRSRFGFVDLEPLENRDAAARYISKYVVKGYSKDTADKIPVGDHLYYASKGLQLPLKIETAPGGSDAVPSSLSVSFSQEYGFDIDGSPTTDPLKLVNPLGLIEWLSP